MGGPSWVIAGAAFSGGMGNNGNGVHEWVHGGGQVIDGSSFAILDDSPSENSRTHWTLELIQNGAGPNRPLRNVNVYICPMLNKG